MNKRSIRRTANYLQSGNIEFDSTRYGLNIASYAIRANSYEQPRNPNEENFIAMQLLGLDTETAHALFRGNPGLTSSEAAKILFHLAETGKIHP